MKTRDTKLARVHIATWQCLRRMADDKNVDVVDIVDELALLGERGYLLATLKEVIRQKVVLKEVRLHFSNWRETHGYRRRNQN